MVAILCVLLIPVTLLMGKAVLKILYCAGKREPLFLEDAFLTGVILLIGLAEAAHLGAMACGRSVSVAVKLLVILTAGMVLFCAAVLIFCSLRKKRIKKNGRTGDGDGKPAGEASCPTEERTNLDRKREVPVLVCLGILAVILVYRILAGVSVYMDEDITLETVTSFLQTDRIYEVNPLTGIPYQAGLPSRLKILCLPTFYAVLCRLFSVSAPTLVWKAVPHLVLLGAFAAYSCLAKSLFPKNRLHRELFLLIVLLSFLLGDDMYGMEGFGLLYAGFQGTAIRSAVLLPYLFSLCIRKKWRLALGPVLAEACIVWTLYGLGAGVVILGIFGVAEAVSRRRAGRKEVSKWENS